MVRIRLYHSPQFIETERLQKIKKSWDVKVYYKKPRDLWTAETYLNTNVKTSPQIHEWPKPTKDVPVPTYKN